MTNKQEPEQNFPPSSSIQTSNMAIASLICGILGWIIIPLLGAIVAIVTGHLAKREIRESMGTITAIAWRLQAWYWATSSSLS